MRETKLVPRSKEFRRGFLYGLQKANEVVLEADSYQAACERLRAAVTLAEWLRDLPRGDKA